MENNHSLSAFLAIIGRPNVGKSSLLNRIIGQKVSIVSEKPQTTRTRIMGVRTENKTQFVFVDTPGFHHPKNLLGESMIKAVGDGMCDVDAVLLVVDAAPKFKLADGEIPAAEQELINELGRRKLPAILVINKIDLLAKKEDILSVIARYTAYYQFSSVVPVSAMKNDGVDILLSECRGFARPAPHYFADDDFTDQPERVMVAEIIREKILLQLDKEIPHGVAVDLDRFYEKDTVSGEPILCVEATIYCEKESHKGIIVGKGGSRLKSIGIDARHDIEKFFGIRASINLWVKVKEGWRNRQGAIHTFGLD